MESFATHTRQKPEIAPCGEVPRSQKMLPRQQKEPCSLWHKSKCCQRHHVTWSKVLVFGVEPFFFLCGTASQGVVFVF